MQVRVFLIAALAAGSLWQGFSRWQLRPVHPPDGAIAPADPLQTSLAGRAHVKEPDAAIGPRASAAGLAGLDAPKPDAACRA